MIFNPNIHHRRSIRLREYDYSQNGYYFVNVCTKNRIEYFGEIKNGKMFLNKYGKICEQCFLNLSNHYRNCILDVFIIMPNHVHFIVIIDNHVGAGLKPAPTNTKHHGLFEIVRGFKTFSARKINTSQNLFYFQWQRNYYERIIRNEMELNNIRQYIINNPSQWELDRNNLKKSALAD